MTALLCEDKGKMVLIHTVRKKENGMLLQRRPPIWANEILKIKQYNQLTSATVGDRFIPRRYLYDRHTTNKKLNKSGFKDILAVFSDRVPLNYWLQEPYTRLLDSCLGLENRRLLEFSDQCPFEAEDDLGQTFALKVKPPVLDWGCKPRSKPCAFPETSHTVNGLDEACNPNLIDWAVDGQLCTSIGRNIIIWKRHEDRTMVFNVKTVNALAYCPKGRYLAMAYTSATKNVLELWDVNCRMYYAEIKRSCDITLHTAATCIAWSCNGQKLAIGTQSGLTVLMSVPELLTEAKAGDNGLPIMTLKFSPDMKYLASADVEGFIMIYDWRTFAVLTHVSSKRKCNVFIDWHPWNSGDLVLSEGYPSSIVILHVPSKEIVCFYQRHDLTYAICSVSFSKITGELLVTLAKVGPDGYSDYKVLVMSSIVRVVDVLHLDELGARFMVWSPDGTRLATAGADEMLTIWNFHPKLKELTKAKLVKLGNGLEAELGRELKKWSSMR